MLDGYVSDREQIESIKKWWNDSGKHIVLAVVIGLALGLAWKYWHRILIRRSENASIIYQSVLQADQQNNFSTAQGGITMLMTHYTSTPYASLGALVFAKEAVSQNHLSLALTKIQWAIEHSRESRIKEIAQIYAARILLSQGKTQDALSQLKIVNDKQFQPVVNWVKGDIYSKEGNIQQATMHYDEAKKSFSDFPPAKTLLTEQLANLK